MFNTTRALMRRFILATGILLSCDFGLSNIFAQDNRSQLVPDPSASDAFSPAELEFFEKSIRPLLAKHCFECHGSEKQWNSLRLDLRQAIIAGGESGSAAIPGDPDGSLLLRAIRRTGDLQMPPEKELTKEEIELIAGWIQRGLAWPSSDSTPAEDRLRKQREHWAFQPIDHPRLPAVSHSEWCRTPVDFFILEQLEQRGLSPAPEADRRTLIRRATVDLLGVPPTFEEVESFVKDPAPDPYPMLIERLLDSPLYGQQWARHWLDVARYSDTKGYVYAREERFFVHASAYRDWVVRALNRDLPYDQFLLLQLAADQVIPCEPLSSQGKADGDAKGNRSDLAAMGFLTLGRRFLGVTHDIIDDRIDVVSRGTMGLTAGCARCHDHKYDPIPTADYYSLYGVFQNSHEVLLPTRDSDARSEEGYAAFEAEWKKRTQALVDKMAASRKEAAERVRSRIADYLFAQTELAKYPEEGFDQILATTDLIPSFVRRWERFLARAALEDDPVFRLWRIYSALPNTDFENFAGKKTQELLAFSPSAKQAIHPQVLAAFATTPSSKREVAERYEKVFREAMTKEDPDSLALRSILFEPWSPCEVPEEVIVSNETYFDSATCTELWRLQGEVDRWLNQSPMAPPHAVVLQDNANLIEPRVFKRGNPANKGDVVARHFLTAIAGPQPTPFQHGSGRLELAKAIIDPNNPLTSRVWVNRVWMHHFGAGMVRTPSDFGLRSEPPSHPKLLDWLARYLMESNWSTKAIHRQVMLSATYRQRSDAVGSATDPENRWLGRMNVRRLSFEEMRDTMLAVAGELDTREGGKAADLFAAGNVRRTLYGLVDRQFLPGTLRFFDFANPDLHIPARNETIVPQQALFAMNHPSVAHRASALAARSKQTIGISSEDAAPPGDWSKDHRVRLIETMIQAVFQRKATARELQSAEAFLLQETPKVDAPSMESKAWSYGYGELNAEATELKKFAPLPYFTGSAWQGGTSYPDGRLGWAQLNARGGHPGNDLKHAIVRRWTAPSAMKLQIRSKVQHQPDVGDGIRCSIFSSKNGKLATADVHHAEASLDLVEIHAEAGETIDFVVDILKELNSDQHFWTIQIEGQSTSGASIAWDSLRDFSGPGRFDLDPVEQFAQVLLMSNELMFVD